MGLAMDQMRRGTQVALAFDDEGRRLPVQRRGVIVRIETTRRMEKNSAGKMVASETEINSNPTCGVNKIWVSFKRGAPPEAVKNANLAFVREGRRRELDLIRNEDAIEMAREIEAREPIVVVDETGISEPGKPLGEAEVAALEAGLSIRSVDAGNTLNVGHKPSARSNEGK